MQITICKKCQTYFHKPVLWIGIWDIMVGTLVKNSASISPCHLFALWYIVAECGLGGLEVGLASRGSWVQSHLGARLGLGNID